MLLKKIIGILIIVLNIGGLGLLGYFLFNFIKEKLLEPHDPQEFSGENAVRKEKPKIVNDDIIPDEDDLLKDMDLSDLDNLNLDDFD